MAEQPPSPCPPGLKLQDALGTGGSHQHWGAVCLWAVGDQRFTVRWCMQNAPLSTLLHALSTSFPPQSTAPYVVIPPYQLSIDTMNQCPRPTDERTSSIVSQSPPPVDNESNNASNNDYSISRRVQFPTILHDCHRNDKRRSTSPDNLDRLVSSVHTSPMIDRSNVNPASTNPSNASSNNVFVTSYLPLPSREERRGQPDEDDGVTRTGRG